MMTTARYGYGYLVNIYDVAETDEIEFRDSIFTYPLESDGEDFFFGLMLHSAEPGYAIPLPSVDNYAHEDFIKMVHEFKKFFPERDAMTIKHYLINEVDV